MGPDGLIYISGARHAVFRVKWGENEKPELFVGTPDKPGAGTRSLNGPSGIAFDGQGNLYVADRNNHRIAVFDPDGGFLTRIPLEWPRRLVVHPRTGAIYATSGFRNQHLVKFSHRSEGKPVARCDLRTDWPSIALDGRGSKPILYVGNVKTRDPKLDPRTRVLIRLIDAGDKFTSEKVLSASARPKQPLLYGVDRERELVYGNWPYEGWWRMDGRTGRIETFDTLLAAKANGITEISAGADGTVVVHVRGEIGRLDRHLMPRPFSATGTYTYNFPKEDSLRSYYGRDVTIAPNGDIYWIHERGGYANPMRCSAVNFDGTRKKDSLIVFETGSPAGVRVDRQGCIYVIDHLKPLGRLVPEEMDHKITRRRLDRFVHHYGSLLKFKPTGGKVRLMGTGVPKARQLESGQMQFTAVEGRGDFVVDGALWSYFGVSMIRPARPRSGCQCWTPRFDLDDFARVFVPDELRSRIIVLDTNGNELMTFGRYGNADDHGPGIPLADPRTVMVSREAAYIGDMTNQRVVRAKLSYRRSAGCTVTVPARTLTEVARELREQDRILERRIALRLMNAELRVADLRAEAAKLSPRVKHRLDWDGLVLKVAARASGALANREDAQAELAVTAPREVRDWREREVDALLGKYLASGGEGLRLAVVWGLWDGRCGKAGEELLLQALKDESQLVRVTAAYVLLDRKNTAGLAHVFQGALSKDSNVYKMAETAILKKVLGAGHSIGKAEVEALGEILRQTRGADRASRTSYWYLRRAVFLMLPLSTDRAGAESALLAELRAGEQLTGNNLNRVIRGLGVVRSVKAIPDLVGFLKRGRNPGWRGGHGDRAESFAATALANIAAPESVAPIIELLDSETAGTAAQSLRALTLMFDPGAPADRRLVPRAGRLEQVRIARLPRPTAIRGAWEEFWKASGAKYERDPDGPPLRVKAGK